MLDLIVTCLFFLGTILSVSPTTTTTLSPVISSNSAPFITRFLVFSSNLETVLTFAPKAGWILNEERQMRLFISGYHLQNSSIVFSASLDECTDGDFVSPIYPLSAASIIEILVDLEPASKTHSSVYVCLLTPWSNSSSSTNMTEFHDARQLEGAYFTFLREKGRLPFAAKICLILMLFIVSGFFR